jgi:hypothetical protein
LFDDCFAFMPDCGAAGAMNGAADASAMREVLVGGVDDGVDVLEGDVAGEESDGTVVGERNVDGRH